MHRSRRRTGVLLACAAVLVLALGLGLTAAVRAGAAPPPPMLTASVAPLPAGVTGSPPPIPLPEQGSVAVASDSGGVLAGTAADVVRPIGSVAKTMTALVVLEHRPLPPGGDGPVLTLTGADVALYEQAIAEGGSAVRVTAGERLTERQMLLALMLPSANNLAETLARWVGGTRDAFIAMLNSEAASLGMRGTRFADPSGYSPATVSTASDLVRLGLAALRNDAFVSVVSTQQVTLPDGTVLRNLDTLLASEPGWLGVKTGWTPQAGGCLLFAARQTFAAGTQPVTVVGAALGQRPLRSADPAHPELGGAFAAATAAVRAVFAGYTVLDGSALHPAVSGRLTTRWGAASGLVIGTFAGHAAVVRMGTPVRLTLTSRPPRAGPRGSVVGTITLIAGGSALGSWDVALAQDIPAPTTWWRILND